MQAEASEELEANDVNNLYVHPGFRFDLAAHEQILDQATNMQAILDGKQVRDLLT